jgi:hypothetical protein
MIELMVALAALVLFVVLVGTTQLGFRHARDAEP